MEVWVNLCSLQVASPHSAFAAHRLAHRSRGGSYEFQKWSRFEIKSFVSSSKRLYLSCDERRRQWHISASMLGRNLDSRDNFSGFYSLRAAVTAGCTVCSCSSLSSGYMKDVNSPKSLQISWKNRQTTRNTTVQEGKSILLRNRSNF